MPTDHVMAFLCFISDNQLVGMSGQVGEVWGGQFFVHSSLKPVSVSNDEEEEILVVEAELAKSKVRYINGYGPQENSPEYTRKQFYDQLDLEIKKAKLAETLVCIEMDSNAKLGPSIIPGDPKPMSENGKLLEKVIVDNELIVVNATHICEGIITRYRKTVNGEEESVLDHFIVCRDMFKLVKNMKIDEIGQYSLTKYSNKTGEKSYAKESDHRTIIIELNLAWPPETKHEERVEIFDYKNSTNFERFVQNTEANKDLENCFKNDEEDLEKSAIRWLKVLKNIIKTSFNKIRIKKKKMSPELDALFKQKETLKAKIAENENLENIVETAKLYENLDNVNAKIAQLCSHKNKSLVDEYLGRNNDVFEGFTQAKTWKLKKRLSPKNTIDPPAAKKDDHGNLVTDREALEDLYLKTYQSRLQPNPINTEYEDIKSLKTYLLNLEMKISKSQVSSYWSLKDLNTALKSFKNNKARDEHGHVYELFKYGGNSLKISLLKLFNLVKETQSYPSIFQQSNISSFWKKKADKSDLENDRGVFNVNKIRSILDKMIYNDIYDTIDENMSASNIGARKNRNIRDHLFVINGVTNDILNNKENKNRNIDIQIYDVAKCFDKLEYVNTATDLFKAGVKNDKFAVIAKSNENCQVAIKTPWGSKTKRVEMKHIEMQGTVLAGLKCSISIDTIGKEFLDNTHEVSFKYKNCVSLPPLSLIDDILCVTTCSSDSVKMNSIIQSKLQGKQLLLGHKKCFQMHIGKSTECCPVLKVHGKTMHTAKRERYLGDVLTSDCKIDSNVHDRVSRGMGHANEILSILKEISFGYHYFNMALQFRNAKLINGMLCSIEALYGLNNNHMEQLEHVDKFFMRKIFNCVITTPIEAYYLETGALPIRFIIIARRLLFYWTILHKSDSELVKQALRAQQISPVKNDWWLKLCDDMKVCDIELSEAEILRMKKSKFKQLVATKVREASRKYLTELKNKHSKSINLDTYKLQTYLTSNELTTDEKQLLFHLRTRSFHCKANYKNQYGLNLACFICGLEDNQQHLLFCSRTTAGVNIDGVAHSDIFSIIEKQVNVAKILKKVTRNRKFILENSSIHGSQAHL